MVNDDSIDQQLLFLTYFSVLEKTCNPNRLLLFELLVQYVQYERRKKSRASRAVGLISCRTSGCIPTKGTHGCISYYSCYMKQSLRFHPKNLPVELPFYDKPVMLI